MSMWPRRGTVLAALTTLTALIAGALVTLTITPAAQAATYTVSGIDVAGYQHPGYGDRRKPGWVPDYDSIDWVKVASSGQQFAIIKASEGSDFVNPYFASDTAKARAAGLIVGAYHYAKPGSASAITQAQHFARVIGDQRAPRTLPPVLDIEEDAGLTKAQLATWVQTFLDELQRLTGRTPMIYSYQSFVKDEIGRLATFARYPLWLARYSSTPPAPVGAWSSWSIWQYTSKGSVPGIEGSVDVNWFNGSRDQLLALADGGSCRGRAPAAPTALTAARDYQDARLQWAAPADTGGEAITRYAVAVDGVVDGFTPTNRYVAMSLTPGPHTFAVAAVNCAGTGPSVTATFTVDPPGPGETPPPPAATTVTIGRLPTLATGTTAGVTATLRRADTSQTLRGQSIAVSAEPTKGRSVAATTQATEAPGEVTRALRFTSNTAVVAAFAGTARLSPASTVSAVRVKPVVRGVQSRKKVRKGKKVVLRARVDAAHAGDRVAHQKWRNGKWRTQSRKRLGSAGRATFTLYPRKVGKARFRMYVYKTPDHLGAGSPTLTVKVKKPKKAKKRR